MNKFTRRSFISNLVVLGASAIIVGDLAAETVYSPKRRTVLYPGDDLAAALAQGGKFYLSAGTYNFDRLDIPDGADILGAGRHLVHLNGHVTFRSSTVVRGVKAGTYGHSVHNRADAIGTLWDDCQFRGGGGANGGTDVPTLLLGEGTASASDITFHACNVECNLGNWNNISIRENAWAGGAHMSDITFDGCHVGVHNGVRDGSPRAGLEAWVNPDYGVTHAWTNIVLVGNEWEAADACTINLPDPWAHVGGSVRGGPALVSNNLIKGGGRAGSWFGYSICVESPENVVVENNTIWRARNNTIGTAPDGVSLAGPIFRNNIIDLSVDNGITRSVEAIYVRGYNPQFLGNTIISDGHTTYPSGALFKVENTNYPVVTGNTITTNGSPVWKLWPATIQNETFSPNVIDGVTV